MDRVKTFEDALNELDLIHPFVKSYYEYADSSYSGEWKDTDILAYLKLRIICAALNEGWQPKFTEDERLYYPWFSLYSKGELENMSENNKKGVVVFDTDDYETKYAGLACANSPYAPPVYDCARRFSPLLKKQRPRSLLRQTVHQHLGGLFVEEEMIWKHWYLT